MMSEKVILTQEQAEELEIRKRAFDKEHTVRIHARREWEYIKCFNELSLDDLIRALYIGYEVEETIEVGDWVVCDIRGDIGRVVKVYEQGAIHCDNDMGGTVTGFSHATPEEIAQEKERRWWKKNGRYVHELKEGDVIRALRGTGKYEYIVKISDVLIETDKNAYKHSLDTLESIEVVYFTEDRKDV